MKQASDYDSYTINFLHFPIFVLLILLDLILITALSINSCRINFITNNVLKG